MKIHRSAQREVQEGPLGGALSVRVEGRSRTSVHICAVIFDCLESSAALLVRKHGTRRFLQLGKSTQVANLTGKSKVILLKREKVLSLVLFTHHAVVLLRRLQKESYPPRLTGTASQTARDVITTQTTPSPNGVSGKQAD
ncbi:hypothetical protein O3P69_020676 [Scylla paramamosain]|uniref:Uncharacterized protein n=1 Tax=Scylla paramamosain TaxID=85552 RepID=A0AAW0TMD1_SCYPA